MAPSIPLPAKYSTASELPLAVIVSIVLLAIATTGWLTFAASHVETLYLRHYPYFCDPSSYYEQNIHIFEYWKNHGTWETVLHELQFNSRHPLRTVPYLIFAPTQLVSTSGHLWTQMPLVFLFLSTFAVIAYLRTRSLYFAIAGMSAFVAFPFMYDPTIGLGAYWLDFAAACAMGTAALCLAGFLLTHRKWWLVAFGACFSATALCRFSSTFYLLVFASVALPAVFWVETKGSKLALARCSAAALSTAIPGIAFVLAFLDLNRRYYQTFGFAFGASISQSIEWTVHALSPMFGLPMLITFGVIAVSGFFLSAWTRQSLPFCSLMLWYPLSMFLFVCFVVRAINGTHPLVYFAPAFLISSFLMHGDLKHQESRLRTLRRLICSAVIVTSVILAGTNYNTNRKLANHAPEAARLAKQCDQDLANLIIKTQAPSFLQMNNESVNPHLEVFFSSSRVCSYLPIFSKHEAYLRGMYPGQTLATMKNSMYARAKRMCALIAVFAKPADARISGVYQNNYSSAIAEYVSARVAGDHDFQHVKTVESPNGLLSVYWNKRYDGLSTVQQ